MRFEWQDVEQRVRADEDGYTVTILAPDGTPYELPNGDAFTITMAGPSTLASQSARTATAQRFAQFVTLDASGGIQVATPDAYAASEAVLGGELDLFSRVVSRWNLMVGDNSDARAVECTPSNVRTLLLAQPDIRRQLREADAQRRATFRSGAKNGRRVRNVARTNASQNAGRKRDVQAPNSGGAKAGHARRPTGHRGPHAAADA